MSQTMSPGRRDLNGFPTCPRGAVVGLLVVLPGVLALGCAAKAVDMTGVVAHRDLTQREFHQIRTRIHTIKILTYRYVNDGTYHVNALKLIARKLIAMGYRVVPVWYTARSRFVSDTGPKGTPMLKASAPLGPGEAFLEVITRRHVGRRVHVKTSKDAIGAVKDMYGFTRATIYKYSAEVVKEKYRYCSVVTRLYLKHMPAPVYFRTVKRDPSTFSDVIPKALAGMPRLRKRK